MSGDDDFLMKKSAHFVAVARDGVKKILPQRERDGYARVNTIFIRNLYE